MFLQFRRLRLRLDPLLLLFGLFDNMLFCFFLNFLCVEVRIVVISLLVFDNFWFR